MIDERRVKKVNAFLGVLLIFMAFTFGIGYGGMVASEYTYGFFYRLFSYSAFMIFVVVVISLILPKLTLSVEA